MTDPFAGPRQPDEPFEILAVPFMGPVIGLALFGMLLMVAVGVALWWSLGVGLVLVAVFGAMTVALGWHSIPTHIRIDEAGVTFRTKLKTTQVRWEELESVGTWFEIEELPGHVALRLKPEARASHGLPDGHTDVRIEALEDLHQDELRDLIVSWWRRAGGSGETFTPMSDLRRTTDMLAGIAKNLLEVQKKENPVLAQMMSDEEKWGPKPTREDEPKKLRGPGVIRVAGSESGNDDIYCAVMDVLDEENRLYFAIIAGGRSHGPLMAEIERSIFRRVKEHRDSSELAGRFEISLVPDLTPMTKHLPAKMDEMVASLTAKLADVKTTDGRPLTISWRHGHPPKAG